MIRIVSARISYLDENGQVQEESYSRYSPRLTCLVCSSRKNVKATWLNYLKMHGKYHAQEIEEASRRPIIKICTTVGTFYYKGI